MDEWIKICDMYNEIFSHEKVETLSFITNCGKLEYIMLSETSQRQILHDYHLCMESKKSPELTATIAGAGW